MSQFADVNESDFSREILESAQPVIVFFWAPWSKSCEFFIPALEDFAEKRKGPNTKLVKVDIEANKTLIQQTRLGGIPALLLYKNGEVVAEIIGTTGPDELGFFFAKAR